MNDTSNPYAEVRGPDYKPLILIVDDSPTIRLSLSRALQDEFRPVEAVDGEQAWEFISSDTRIEVVIYPCLNWMGWAWSNACATA